MLFIAVLLWNNANVSKCSCFFHFNVHLESLHLFLLPSDVPPEFMLKRMASKFSAHLGIRTHLPKEENPISLSSPSSSTLSYIPTIPVYDYRSSMSTERTLASQDTLEVVETRRVRLPQRPRGTYRLSDFIIQRTLGTGSFGRVHLGQYDFGRLCSVFFYRSISALVRSKHNLRFYAIKVLNKERIARMKQIEHTNNEQRMLQSVQHAFIINLWGVFQDAGNLYMVMDFIPGGELFTLLRRSNVCHFFLNMRIND